jgi:UDP-glucose 4-epimerase
MSILVTGGAGYVGGTVVDRLLARGEAVVVADNLSRSPDSGLPADVPFYRVDVGDRDTISGIVRSHDIDACLHFAGLIAVGESVERPGLYFEQNVSQTITLLDALVAGGVGRFVFSSSAAVYGEPLEVPIPEDHPHRPTSPYGATKSIVEQILTQYDRSDMLRSVSLRYFNAAGAAPGRAERHIPETHLIPLALQAVLGQRGRLKLFGRDYETRDGTCIRDYIHVCDLAVAHRLALSHLWEGNSGRAWNLGTGNGTTVLEVLDAIHRVTGNPVPYDEAARRPGDPPGLYAAADRVKADLGWAPSKENIDQIVADAWTWIQNAAY